MANARNIVLSLNGFLGAIIFNEVNASLTLVGRCDSATNVS